MRVILEGPDGIGKSTLANKLADHFGCDILHSTENGSKEYQDYFDKAHLDNMIMDRCFLSELVYACAFNRRSKVPARTAEKLIKIYREIGWQIIILGGSQTFLNNRLNLRGDEDEAKVAKSRDISLLYSGLSYFYGIPVIDLEHTSTEEIIKNLEELNYGSLCVE